MLSILICDDNPLLLEKTSRIIQKILHSQKIPGEVVCTAQSCQEVELFLAHHTANVFFLDIDLHQEKNGYDLAVKIRELDCMAYIIFVTGHFEYALQAFKVKAFDFLYKPVAVDVLEQCLKRIQRDFDALQKAMHAEEKFLLIKADHCIQKVPLSNILLVEKMNFKVIVHLENEQISYYDTLDHILKNLDQSQFIRVHKSFIANIHYIEKINLKEKHITFTNGTTCCIGDKYRDVLQHIVSDRPLVT
jgi:DNA-binding LytR/AlgR family response regulator